MEYTFTVKRPKSVNFAEFTFMPEESSLVLQRKLSRFAIIWV